MSRKYLTHIDLTKNELQNAVIQNLSSAPGSPVEGQVYYDTTAHALYIRNNSAWVQLGAGSGDASTNTSSSVDSEIALFSSTTGKLLKRATGTGIAKITSGVLSTATSATDYAPATTGSSALKASSGGFGTATINDLGAQTADYSAASHKITNVTDPASAQDAATKAYVDATAQGLQSKAPVRVATTANGTLASAFANGSTVDGVTLATGDRILLKDQTTVADRGIYIVAASGAPSRATDADASGEIKDGTAVWVQSGTANADQIWVVTATASTPWVPGTDGSTWVQFSGASTTTAGAGLTATGNVLAVGAGTSISVGTDSVTVDRTTNGSLVALCYVATVGDNSSTAIAVTHGLGRQYVTAQVFDASANTQVDCDVTLTSTTVTTFTFVVAPTTNQYRVVITG